MSKPWSLVALAVALLPWTSLAESGFRVSPETGLELGDHGEDASARKKKEAEATAPSADKKPTEITASQETTFDERARVAVFLGNVTVNDPQFQLTCDKLTAYLKKPSQEPGKKKTEGETAAPSPSPKPSPTPSVAANGSPAGAPKKDKDKNEPDPGGGLDRAIAEGKVVIIQDKVDPNTGAVTRYLGKSARADYNAATGDVTLTGWPQIQQGINNQVATEERTVMILNRNGHLKTIGPSKTEISESSDPARKNDAAKPGQTGQAGRKETRKETPQIP